MQEIKCPNCGEVFVVDESGYAQIVQQVRDKEFDKELRRREEELAGKQESELRLLKLEQKQEYDAALAKKETEIQKLDRLIAELRAQISGTESLKRPISQGRGVPSTAVRAAFSSPRGSPRFREKSLVVPAGR